MFCCTIFFIINVGAKALIAFAPTFIIFARTSTPLIHGSTAVFIYYLQQLSALLILKI